MTLIALTCMHNYKDRRSSIADGYIEALEKVGATPVVLPPSLSPQASAKALQGMDGLLLTGGPDMSPLYFGQQPQPGLGSIDVLRDEQEVALIKEAYRLGKPMLGICRGMQMINAVLGGTIIQHLKLEGPTAIQHQQRAVGWHKYHHVEVRPGTILASAIGDGIIGVNSFHHQVVDEIAPRLVVSATSPDGLVEAIEGVEPWILGIQWHPEMMWKRYPEFLGLFKVFAAACKGEKGND